MTTLLACTMCLCSSMTPDQLHIKTTPLENFHIYFPVLSQPHEPLIQLFRTSEGLSKSNPNIQAGARFTEKEGENGTGK